MPITLERGLSSTGRDLVDDGETSAGQRDTGERGDLVLMYQTREDSRVRPEHAALHGRIWELDDMSAPNPPLGYGCRCQMVIVPRKKAERERNDTPKESLQSFDDFEKNLARVYPEDVVDAFRSGDLKDADLIVERTGDRINAAQARAIIAARRAGTSETKALVAVAQLFERGISGRSLWAIVADAKRRIQDGASPIESAEAAILATPRRGYVTARKAKQAASELVASELLR